ncbi:MAG: hypothetical protein ABR600_09165 [Actinomycetota bacterium]
MSAIIALALAMGVAGYVLGPPIVQAGTSAIRIASGKSSSQLKVSGGRAAVDTEADTEPAGILFSGKTILTSVDLGYVFQQAGGNFLIAQGTSSNGSACANSSIVSGVVVDNTASANSTVSIAGDTNSDGAGGDPIWQGTVPSGGHLNDTMDGGVFSGSPLSVTVSGAAAQWYVYGLCFSSSSSVASRITQRLLQSHMLAGKR